MNNKKAMIKLIKSEIKEEFIAQLVLDRFLISCGALKFPFDKNKQNIIKRQNKP